MRRTIRVLLCDRKQAWGHFFFASVFGACVIAPLFFGHYYVALFFPVFLPLCLWTMGTGLAHLKHDGLEAVCTREGLEVHQNEAEVWRLSWEDYGGYRYAKQPLLERWFQQEKGGVEILNRAGEICGTLPLYMPYSQNADKGHMMLKSQINLELEQRVPENGIKPSEPEPSWLAKTAERHPYWVLLTGAVPGVILLGLIMVAVDGYKAGEPPTGWVGWIVQGYRIFWLAAPLCVTTPISLYGFLGLAKREARRRVEKQPELLPPYEGPSLREHVIDQFLSSDKTLFQEGMLYRYVQPEAIKRLLRTEIGGTRFVGIAGALMLLVLSEGAIWSSPGTPKWLSILPIVGVALIWLLARARCIYCEQIAKSLDDTLVWEKGVLTVIKPEGTHLHFPMAKPRAVRMVMQSVRVRVLKHDGHRYAYDPTHMFPADESV